jgi:heterodisulfide reductase subunit E
MEETRMYLYFEATAVLYTLTVISVLLCIAGILTTVALWRKGKAKSLHHKLSLAAVLKAFITDVVFQAQILKVSLVRWLMHFCIFIGFMGLLAQTSLMAFISHFAAPDSFLAQSFFHGGGSRVLDIWGDLFGVILLLGLLIALCRRFVFKTKQLETIAKDTTSLLLLTVIGVTGFMSEAFRLMDPQYADVAWFSFAGMLLSQVLQAFGISAMSYTFWVWVHAGASFIFIAFIPFSKAWHIFVSPIEIVLDASERA